MVELGIAGSCPGRALGCHCIVNLLKVGVTNSSFQFVLVRGNDELKELCTSSLVNTVSFNPEIVSVIAHCSATGLQNPDIAEFMGNPVVVISPLPKAHCTTVFVPPI